MYSNTNQSIPCYYSERQQQDRRPSQEFSVTPGQSVNCDKPLSTVPTVKRGCSIYCLLELGFVGFGACWQPIVVYAGFLKALKIYTRCFCVYIHGYM